MNYGEEFHSSGMAIRGEGSLFPEREAVGTTKINYYLICKDFSYLAKNFLLRHEFSLLAENFLLRQEFFTSRCRIAGAEHTRSMWFEPFELTT